MNLKEKPMKILNKWHNDREYQSDEMLNDLIKEVKKCRKD